jgi:hypothetical protein
MMLVNYSVPGIKGDAAWDVYPYPTLFKDTIFPNEELSI